MPLYPPASSGSSQTASYQILNGSIAASVASNLLTVALKQPDGSSDPGAGTAAVNIGFRISTQATPGYNVRSVTSSLSVNTVSTSATLGLQSGSVIQYIYVYALDNAGTVELALAGSQIFDESVPQNTSTMGSSSTDLYTLYSTTGRTNVPVRLIGRLTVVNATAGTFAGAPTQTSLLQFQPIQQRSVVKVYGSLGPASTNTAILHYNTIATNIGGDISYSTSSTAGDTFTINHDGLYTGGINNYNSSGAAAQGMSVNSNQLTTGISSITAANILTETASPASGTPGFACWTAFLRAGDVVRPHCNSGAGISSTDATLFCYVARIG